MSMKVNTSLLVTSRSDTHSGKRFQQGSVILLPRFTFTLNMFTQQSNSKAYNLLVYVWFIPTNSAIWNGRISKHGMKRKDSESALSAFLTTSTKVIVGFGFEVVPAAASVNNRFHSMRWLLYVSIDSVGETVWFRLANSISCREHTLLFCVDHFNSATAPKFYTLHARPVTAACNLFMWHWTEGDGLERHAQSRDGFSDFVLSSNAQYNTFIPKSNQYQISSCRLTRNITSHSMENLAFHSSLRGQMIVLPILTTSRTFWTWEWRVKGQMGLASTL